MHRASCIKHQVASAIQSPQFFHPSSNSHTATVCLEICPIAHTHALCYKFCVVPTIQVSSCSSIHSSLQRNSNTSYLGIGRFVHLSCSCLGYSIVDSAASRSTQPFFTDSPSCELHITPVRLPRQVLSPSFDIHQISHLSSACSLHVFRALNRSRRSITYHL